mgnify:FL=1
MKIFVLEEYNTQRTMCISEDILLIKKARCNKEYFSTKYNDYPILTIWENGKQIDKMEGMNVLRRISDEVNKFE